MKNRFICKCISVFLGITSGLYAQQEVGLVFATDHMNIINPAFVSVSDKAFVRSSLSKQWSGVAHSPETAIISFGSSVGKNLSMGLSVISDKTFIEKETFVGADFSYKLSLDSISKLHFGIKAGGFNYNINASGLETYNVGVDPNLFSYNKFNPNFGLGVVYTRGDFYASLSAPRLLNTIRAKNDEGRAASFVDTPHFYFGTGYNFNLDSQFKLKPSALLRYVTGNPLSIDFNAMIDYNNIFEFGVLYRTGINSTNVFAGKANIKIGSHFNLGYGFARGVADLASAGNSNELFLQYKF